MTRAFIVLATTGILGSVSLFAGGTVSAFAGAIVAGHMSPMSIGGPVAPFNEPRYNLGPGNIAPEASADSCMRICMTGLTGTMRRARQSCRKSCASNEF